MNIYDKKNPSEHYLAEEEIKKNELLHSQRCDINRISQ